MLQLAIQPDSWGERIRARLMSELAPALRLPSDGGSTLSTEEIVQVTNAVVPCFLLELGRRKQHIQVEFPLNPATRTPTPGTPMTNPPLATHEEESWFMETIFDFPSLLVKR